MVIQLKITLVGVRPPLWRRILIADSITFFDLHHILQIVMGWKHLHLFDFKVGDYLIGSVHEGSPENLANAKIVTVDTLLTNAGIQFIYYYDFGDGWSHQVEVEKISEEATPLLNPVCLEGERNCPPEDCGGVAGYEHLLAILKDKNHPEHHEIKRWTGKGFDPEKLDFKKINKLLPKFRSYLRSGGR